MKVIAGSAKGRKLKVGKKDRIRPTQQKVKEALFSIIEKKILGANFLDLFAGYGNVGIEALSRGAEKVIFVEEDFLAAKVIKENLERTGFNERGKVLRLDVIKALKLLEEKAEFFNFVFLDPPYKSKITPLVLDYLSRSQIVNSQTLIILEDAVKEEVLNKIDGLVLIDQRKYGDSRLSFFRLA